MGSDLMTHDKKRKQKVQIISRKVFQIFIDSMTLDKKRKQQCLWFFDQIANSSIR